MRRRDNESSRQRVKEKANIAEADAIGRAGRMNDNQSITICKIEEKKII